MMRLLCFLFASTAFAQSAPDAMKVAIEQQKAAARVQAKAAGAQAIPWGPAPPMTTQPCAALAESKITSMIDRAAKARGIAAKLLRAVIEQESGFRPCAISSKGAQGLAQLMPQTSAELGVKDPFDPKQSIDGGARYLKQLIDKYKGDLKLALAAYNAGPTTVDATGAVPDIPETRDYVEAVLARIATTVTSSNRDP